MAFEFDFNKLRGRIIEKFGTCANFAEAMGFGPSWISDRLLNKQPWDIEEIRKAILPEFLDIPVEEIPTYFFKEKVR